MPVTTDRRPHARNGTLGKLSTESNLDHATSMRASRLHGVRDLRLEVLPRPEPGPGQVLLQVASVGVCGSDVHYYLHGRIGTQVVTGPIILGHEFSARVAALGPPNPQGTVSDLQVGQLVAVDPGVSCRHCEPCMQGHPNLCPNVRFCATPPVDGVLAEYTVMPAENCFPLPPEVGAIQGAMLEPLGVALHSVDLAHLQPGCTVAVLGAGPIGLLIAAVARASGASQIYMTEPLPDRRRFASEYVADTVLNPDDSDVQARILALTGGRGVDAAFEAAGARETPQQAAAVARIGGSVIIAGIPAEEDAMTFIASVARSKGLTIKMVRRMKHAYPRAIRLAQSAAIDLSPLATHRFPLGQVSEAFEMVAGYKDGVLRAMIQVSD